MLDFIIQKEIENFCQSKIIEIIPVSGGCINSAFQVKTENKQTFFLKVNHSAPDKMFEREANGLSELKKSNAIIVPDVIKASNNFLILEFIKGGNKGRKFWQDFGQRFAILHKFTSKKIGFYEDNYLGSNIQINSSYSLKNWAEFFYENRILFQFRLSEKNNLADKTLRHGIKELEKIIHKILDIRVVPSLLHGDLWAGNFLVDQTGNPCLIDPAVYYGHREVDLAMTKLFSGFSNEFYESYNEEFPLEDGYEYRENIYKLYHVLNHLNLFGLSYYRQAISLINYYLK